MDLVPLDCEVVPQSDQCLCYSLIGKCYISTFQLIVVCAHLSHDVKSGSDISSCIKIDKPLVGNIFSNIM